MFRNPLDRIISRINSLEKEIQVAISYGHEQADGKTERMKVLKSEREIILTKMARLGKLQRMIGGA